MPQYTTSYSSKKKPHYRRNTTNQLPSGQRRRQRRPGAQYLRHSQGFGRRSSGRTGRPMNTNNARKPYAIIVVGCAFLFFVASVIWYANRSVTVTLNGSEASVRINSSIEQFITDQQLDPTPGDLLAVDDSVLEKRGGERVSVVLDGERVEDADLATTKLSGGEELEIEDGRNRYEEHDVQATAIQPKLTQEGSGAISYVETWGVPGRSEVWTGKQSGITQDRGVVQEVVDCVVVSRSVSPDDKDKKYVALTFDEGPSSNTQQIIDVLKEKDATATFFLSGDAVEARPSAAKAIVANGFEVGSNAYSDTSLSALSGDDLHSQLTRGFDAIETATGSSTALLRAPYAAFSADNWAESMDIVSAVVSWNVDSGDWVLPGADAVTETVLSATGNGNIVLLNDNESASGQLLEALPGIIDGLREKGFTLVSLSDLIATDEDLAEELSLFTVKMPADAAMPQFVDAGDTDEA